MARCPRLDYRSGDYYCTVTEAKMEFGSTKVKEMCDKDYGDEYKNCPVYQRS